MVLELGVLAARCIFVRWFCRFPFESFNADLEVPKAGLAGGWREFLIFGILGFFSYSGASVCPPPSGSRES